MPKNNRPLTIKDIKEVLIPAMEAVFATKKELTIVEAKLDKFINDSLTNDDKILKELEILMTEKVVANHQEKQRQKIWQIVITALVKHKILAPHQLKRIKALGAF